MTLTVTTVNLNGIRAAHKRQQQNQRAADRHSPGN